MATATAWSVSDRSRPVLRHPRAHAASLAPNLRGLTPATGPEYARAHAHWRTETAISADLSETNEGIHLPVMPRGMQRFPSAPSIRINAGTTILSTERQNRLLPARVRRSAGPRWPSPRHPRVSAERDPGSRAPSTGPPAAPRTVNAKPTKNDPEAHGRNYSAPMRRGVGVQRHRCTPKARFPVVHHRVAECFSAWIPPSALHDRRRVNALTPGSAILQTRAWLLRCRGDTRGVAPRRLSAKRHARYAQVRRSRGAAVEEAARTVPGRE